MCVGCLAKASGPPEPLIKTYNEICIVSTAQPMDQVVLLAFKSYSLLGHTLLRAIATTGSESFDGLVQSTLKIF